MMLDVVAFVFCLILTMAQLAILDYYFIKHLDGQPEWYAWIAGDVLVLLAYIVCLVAAIRYNQRCMEEVCASDANIRYAWVAWGVYSAVLIGKVAVTFRLYHDKIGNEVGFENLDQIFGRHTYRLTLALTAVIFLLMVESHHYTALASPRQLYLTYLATAVTLDILDSVLFLDLLWDEQIRGAPQMDFALEVTILVLACFNFFLPTFALLKLVCRRLPRFIPLPYEKLYALLYVLCVNIPYLVIRSFLWRHVQGHDVSIFVVKNAIMVYLAVREAWTRLQYWRVKRIEKNGGPPTAPAMTADEQRHLAEKQGQI